MSKQLTERESIQSLEGLIKSSPKEEQLKEEDLTGHYFAPGVYARTFFIPAGAVVIGKIHKTEHLNIVCHGRCSVYTEDGPIIFQGPCVFTSGAGVKKAVYAFEDTTWITIHVTEETALAKIEQDVIAKSYEEIEYQSFKIEDK